jgi:hypothetical protein
VLLPFGDENYANSKDNNGSYEDGFEDGADYDGGGGDDGGGGE